MKVNFKLMIAGYCTHPEIMSIKKGSWKTKEFPAIFALISHPKHGNILFDTGYAPRFYDETRFFPFSIYKRLIPAFIKENECAYNQLSLIGINKEEINYVIISHFHADHICGLKDFPNAQFICFKSSFEKLKKLTKFKALKKGFLSNLLPDDFENRIIDIEKKPYISCPRDFYPFSNSFDIFEDKSINAIHLKGHTNDQLGIFFKDNNERYIFLVSDACWSSEAYKKYLLPNFLSNYIFEDSKSYKKTLYDLHILHKSNPNILIIPSHCHEIKNKIVNGEL